MPDLKRIRTVAGKHQGLLGLVMVAIFAAVFVVRGQATLHEISGAVRSANPWWMLGAVTAELVTFWLVATKYRIIFDRLGYRLSGIFLARLHLERTAVAAISPIGSAPAYYVYVRELRRLGVPIDDALLAASLSGVAGVVPLVMAVLFAAIHFSSLMLFAGLVAGIGVLGALVGFGVTAFRRSKLPEHCIRRAPKRACVFVERARGHGLHIRDLTLPVAFSLLGRLAGVVTLYLCLRAVGQEPSLLTPIVVSVAGALAARLSPVFRGLGVVEVAMAGSLAQVGIPAAPALGATFLYRFTSLWLPLILGFLVQVSAARAILGPRSKGRRATTTSAGSAWRVRERRWV
jgi:uncharacterized membrane protein YbhN (UPF0104 family)